MLVAESPAGSRPAQGVALHGRRHPSRDTVKAMSEENVEILRRAMPESAPANPEDLFSILAENVEWDYVGAFPEIQTAHGPRRSANSFENGRKRSTISASRLKRWLTPGTPS